MVEPLKVTVGITAFYGPRFENHWSSLALMPTQHLVSWVPDPLPRGAKWLSYEAYLLTYLLHGVESFFRS